MNKLVVGLTGILGSGKSTAAKILADYGARVVDMDEAGRWVVMYDEGVQWQIRTAFGVHVFDDNNQLQRKKLGDIVFSDAKALAILNDIVHPAILTRARLLINKEKLTSECHYIIVDAALIFELGFEKECDLTMCVTAPLELCLRRAQQKSLTRQQALDRIRSQIPQDEKAARADYIIQNDTTMDVFAQRVFDAHVWLLQKAK